MKSTVNYSTKGNANKGLIQFRSSLRGLNFTTAFRQSNKFITQPPPFLRADKTCGHLLASSSPWDETSCVFDSCATRIETSLHDIYAQILGPAGHHRKEQTWRKICMRAPQPYKHLHQQPLAISPAADVLLGKYNRPTQAFCKSWC